jgi:hypothetical protein
LLNTNVKGGGKIMFALTEIKGVGRRYSNLVCKKADIDLNKRYVAFHGFQWESNGVGIIGRLGEESGSDRDVIADMSGDWENIENKDRPELLFLLRSIPKPRLCLIGIMSNYLSLC